MGDDRGGDQDCPPGVEPRRADEEPCAPDAVDAEQSGRVDSMRRDRPVLYAARHLIKPVVQILVTILGIGALLRALLPRVDVDMEWLESWGRENLSWVPDPLGWAVEWLGDRFGEVQVADWIGTVLRNAKWWLPLLFAVAAGIGEILRRWEAAGPPDDPTPADEHDTADENANENEHRSMGGVDKHASAPNQDDEREGLQ